MQRSCISNYRTNDCPLWHELRYRRIAASKAYEAAHCNVLDGALTENILEASYLMNTEAMKSRRLLERRVLKEVEKIKQIKISKCGLKLNTAYLTIEASPDRKITLYSIEIECIASEKILSRHITNKQEVTPKYLTQLQLQIYFSINAKSFFVLNN